MSESLAASAADVSGQAMAMATAQPVEAEQDPPPVAAAAPRHATPPVKPATANPELNGTVLGVDGKPVRLSELDKLEVQRMPDPDAVPNGWTTQYLQSAEEGQSEWVR